MSECCLRLQVGLSPAHGLMGVAGEDGRLECFDPRQRAAVGALDAAAAAGAVSRLHKYPGLLCPAGSEIERIRCSS